MKQLILDKVKDLVADFMFYNRKSDEDLSSEDLENAIRTGEVTIDEIVEQFKKSLEERVW